MDNLEQTLIDLIDRHLSADLGVNTFYHYTSLDALINGIILDKPKNGKEISLRATHCRYLNDEIEVMIGAKIQQKILSQLQSYRGEISFDQIIAQMKNMHILSFSQNPDSLPMWNTYANKSTGVAIGVERLKSKSEYELVLRCFYYPNEMDFKSIPKDVKAIFAAFLPQLLKCDAYSYEKEVRLISDFTDLPTKFREKNGYIIPYKEIFFSKEQIKSITLGPCQNNELAIDSLRNFLDYRGFQHVEIKTSQIPYRNI